MESNRKILIFLNFLDDEDADLQTETNFLTADLRGEDDGDGALSVELTTPLGFGRNASELSKFYLLKINFIDLI